MPTITPLTAVLIAGGTLAGAAIMKKGSAPPLPSKPVIKPVRAAAIGFKGTTVASKQGSVGIKSLTAGQGPTDQTQAQVLAEAKRRAEAQFNKLSASARKAGAQALNQQFGTKLQGTESFSEVLSALGGLGGGAAAGALLGSWAGPIGAVVGAYLGAKIGDYIDDAYADIKDWATDQWDDVEDELGDAWDSAKDWVGSLW